MDDEQAMARPIGWWLREANVRLDAAFDAALAAHDADRRIWQIVATLRRAPATRAEIARALAAFDESGTVDDVIDDLQDRGWLEEVDGALHLTATGAGAHVALAPAVDGVRAQVAQALPGDDYATVVRLLSQFVAALPGPVR